MATKAAEPHDVSQRSGAPPPERQVVLPDREIALHEMPDLTREAPEVEYHAPPKRTWWRYVAVGAVAGIVGGAIGFGIGSIVFGEQASTAPAPVSGATTTGQLVDGWQSRLTTSDWVVDGWQGQLTPSETVVDGWQARLG